MLRVLMKSAGQLIPALALALAMAAVAAERPDADAAKRHSRDVLKEADQVSRDPAFLNQAAEEAARASREAGKAIPAGMPPLTGTPFAGIDAEAMRKAQDDVRRLLQDPASILAQTSGSAVQVPRPIVLVSFSMPEDSLKALLVEADRIGSPLVLHGLVNDSMRDTVDRMMKLTGGKLESEGGLTIDPTLFTRFGVASVPAFIVTADPVPPCSPDGCPTPRHAKVAGDVSLAYALRTIRREASDSGVRDIAGLWISRLEASP